MAARVSVASPSHASSGATRSTASGSTAREAPSAANGFSSQLTAASRPSTPPAGSGDSHSDGTHASSGKGSSSSGSSSSSSANAKSASAPAPAASGATNKQTAGSKPTAKSAAASAAATAASSAQAQNAAATIVEADVSSVDGDPDSDLSTQDGKPSAKATGKAPSDATESSAVASDPAALSLLLAAAGLQVNGYTGGSQQNNQHNASTDQAPEDQTASAIAASVAASMVAPAGLGLSAAVGAPGPQPASGQKPASDTVAASVAGASAKSAVLDADALLSSDATGEFSTPDASLLQTKSSAPDSLQPQPTSVTNSNGLPQMMRGLNSVAASSSGVERTISVPVSDRNWGGAVAGQVQWMVNSNVQSATLQLSPEHLGPVEVRIDVQSSQVNVSFTAAHPDTRSALEQSVPQLRAILANGGLTLGQANVQQEARPHSHYNPGTARAVSNTAQTVDSVSISPTRGLGLIDEYA